MSTAELLDALARGRAGDLINQVLQANPDGVARLDKALGLDRTSRIKARDGALRNAAAALSPGATSNWETARRLSDAVRRFRSRVWPRCRRDTSGLGPVDQALRIAFLSGEPVPRSVKRLARFVDTKPKQRP